MWTVLDKLCWDIHELDWWRECGERGECGEECGEECGGYGGSGGSGGSGGYGICGNWGEVCACGA